ncbi:MarR family winged helix-turn-helix transcriptional regulator [Cohnella faecalis]|uniref:MarR family transcriptional regulator n=1 Tax=Cohnella faecalis TaxID=2315694 RepID=A0A398CUQ9_9BACL|nr:MarR family transcriptional regulator [Cohnella faecalis]RIE02734.1 MarR family transcriptional regulator [Cohnella faecalis]
MDDQQRVLDIFKSFREVNQAFFQGMQKAAQHHGVTPLQFMVLRILNNCPEIRLSELAEQLHLGNSTTSGIIDRMVKADLVSRERSDTDRRNVILKLTDKGNDMWKQTHQTRLERLAPLLELAEEDQAHLQRIHNQIVQILHRVREEETNHE